MTLVDFDQLRRRIADASRRTFDAIQAAHPEEMFYAFALYTVDSAVGVNPSTNSEQAYQRTVALQMADEPQKKWLDSRGISLSASLLGDQCWSAFEWGYECSESTGFEGVNELLNNRGVGFYDEDDPRGFVTFKAGVFASMVLALGDLNSQGYFGSGPARANRTVFCSVADSECAVWLEEDSARRLNPPQVFQRFAEERIRWIGDSSERDESDEDPVRESYLSFLRNA